MSRSTIALLHLAPEPGEIERNLHALDTAVRDAARQPHGRPPDQQPQRDTDDRDSDIDQPPPHAVRRMIGRRGSGRAAST